MGGGRFNPPPLAICQTNGPILDPKTAFGSSGFELSEYVANFFLNVTDEVAGWATRQSFEYLSLLASPGTAVISN